MSPLERCPLFRVSCIERFHCSCAITIYTIMVLYCVVAYGELCCVLLFNLLYLCFVCAIAMSLCSKFQRCCSPCPALRRGVRPVRHSVPRGRGSLSGHERRMFMWCRSTWTQRWGSALSSSLAHSPPSISEWTLCMCVCVCVCVCLGVCVHACVCEHMYMYAFL